MPKYENYYKFNCGCEFPILDEEIKGDNLPSIEIPYQELCLDMNYGKVCQKSFDMISDGKSKGVFQLESYLGNKWGSELKPDNIEELAALISIIRPGCLSKTTQILISANYRLDKNNTRQYKYVSIEQMFKNKKRFKKIISVKENTGELFSNKITDIIYSGKKEVFKLNLTTYLKEKNKDNSFCFALKCTSDHPILTSKGYVELKELKPGDKVAVLQKGLHKKTNPKHVHGTDNHRNICNKHYEYHCVLCDWKKGSLDVNHLNGNTYQDNNPENLCFLCPNDHRLYTEGKVSNEELITKRKIYELPRMKDVVWATYLGKESLGIEDTYDISVDGPHHNFIANNVVVHNCLNAISEDKSLTQHYVDRKWNIEQTIPLNKELEDLLDTTHQIMIYQEDSIRIASKIAGFTEEQGDVLRKSVGTKNIELMKQVESMFTEGCIKRGLVIESEAKEIFDWIRESQRYSFNKCLSGITILKEENKGFTCIQDIQIGDRVLGPSAEKGGSFYKVLDVINNGRKLCYTYWLSNNLSIKCTEDHKVKSRGQMIPIGQIIKRKQPIDTIYGPAFILLQSKGYYTDTYDIEIDSKKHVFYANGIAVSNSHAVSYGYISYLTALVKHHFPLHFFCSWLQLAREKQKPHEEIRELFEESKKMNINIITPNLETLNLNDNDVCIYNNNIHFGLKCMKKIGDSSIKAIHSLLTEKQSKFGHINTWSWNKILYELLINIKSDCAYALITGGVLDRLRISRNRMLNEYEKLRALTKKQLEFLQSTVEDEEPFTDSLRRLYEKVNKTQKDKINSIITLQENTVISEQDRIPWIISQEKTIYGVPVTYSSIDALKKGSPGQDKCEDFLSEQTNFIIAGEIQNLRVFKIKKDGPNKGKTMSSFELVDDTGSVNCVLFDNIYEIEKDKLYDGNLIVVQGYKSKTKSLSVKSMKEIY